MTLAHSTPFLQSTHDQNLDPLHTADSNGLSSYSWNIETYLNMLPFLYLDNLIEKIRLHLFGLHKHKLVFFRHYLASENETDLRKALRRGCVLNFR